LIDFDEIDDWAPKLAAALRDHVPKNVENRIASSNFKYIEDARDLLFELADRDAIIDATLDWVRSSILAGCHGTRLTDAEVASVQAKGLLPLKAKTRRDRLIRTLSSHPRWGEVAGQLDEAIRKHAGPRENQVHLTLSQSGLTNRLKHYHIYGAEFDQHVAKALLGSQGKDLLGQDGSPKLIKFAIPGDVALNAAHLFFSIDYCRSNGNVPNVVGEFLNAWSYKLANPQFQSRTHKVDCGMIFRDIVPAQWIVEIKTLNEAAGPEKC